MLRFRIWIIIRVLLTSRSPGRCAKPRQAGVLRRLHQAAACLPDPDRQILLLHRADRLSVSAIAERLGMSRPEVEVRLAAALVSLADTLNDQAPPT